ncbi:hypothetical protein QFC20_002296 [Naganishia adeliensis]|uniref:Uncharacterized protein n=1 Tax=Naganishia adeliensis TaxID=92952 RepID=A0ACC2WL09_9TREE|nr:hypothetical protein QFC20_002296 [Naganishia adeliensis]
MSSSRISTSSRSSSSLSSSSTSRAHSPLPRIGTGTYFSYLGITASLLGIASGTALFLAFPFPTTIPVFVALLTALTLWTCGTWLGILWSVVGVRVKAKRWWWWSSPGRRSVEEEGYRVLPQDLESEEKLMVVVGGGVPDTTTPPSSLPSSPSTRKSRTSWIILGLATGTMIFLLSLGVTPPPSPAVPPTLQPSAQPTLSITAAGNSSSLAATADGAEQRIFIAANLYNVVDIWETWHTQVLALVEHRVESSSRVVLSERWKGRRTGTSEAGHRREGSRPKKTIGKAGMKCAVGKRRRSRRKRRRSRRNEPDGGGGGGGGSVVLFLSSAPGKDGHKSAVSDVPSARYKVKAQHNRQDDTTCSDAVRNADTIC